MRLQNLALIEAWDKYNSLNRKHKAKNAAAINFQNNYLSTSSNPMPICQQHSKIYS
jgi:hypothetical protein